MKVWHNVKSRALAWLMVVGCVFAVIIATFGLLVILNPIARAPGDDATQQSPEPLPVGVSANTLYFGNVFWGRYINDWSMASPLKTAYPFSRLYEFDRESYDAWIAGLECPTVAGFSQTSAEEDATLSFNCSPDYLAEAAKWFDVFGLANNHTDNQGPEGFLETRRHLDEHNIQYFGHYDPDELEDVCEVIALPMTVTYDDGSNKKEALPVAMCGYHAVFKLPSEESRAIMRAYSEVMPVIATPHMGVEYQPGPDGLKQATYRSLIDNGADMVIADHPHWIQNTEAYNGKLIVYSMGNFIFDQQDTAEVVRSAAIRVVMNLAGVDSSQLKQWLEIGKECEVFHDDCLSRIQQANLTKLPFTYQFGVIGTNNSGKIVKPATPEQQASILQRLNWTHTMSQLQSPQSSL